MASPYFKESILTIYHFDREAVAKQQRISVYVNKAYIKQLIEILAQDPK